MDQIVFLAAAAKLVVLVLALSIPGLSPSPGADRSADAFLARVFLGCGLLAWIGLIVTYFAPKLKWLAFAALCLWLAIVWARVGFAGIRDQLRPVAEVLLVQALACLLVLGAGFLYGGLEEPLSAAAQRWFHWAGDNGIPLTAFKRLATHDWSPMAEYWQISDRPPLQSGFFNLLRPLGRRELDYQLVGIACQSFALTGVYVLLRALAVGHRTALATMALLAPAGFVLMNAFYVWPKLLSAGYLCAAAGVLIRGAQRHSALSAGALAALGLLAHGGAAFSIFAILFVALFGAARSRVPLMIAGMILVALPWLAFTNFVDPPGNRLAKWHLAGVTNPDPRDTVETIITSYKGRSLQQIVDDKLANLKAQVGHAHFLVHAARFGDKAWWDIQFGILAYAVFPAWFAVILAPLHRNSRAMLGRALKLHLLWLCSLALTCMLMFGPALDVGPSVATAYPSLPQQSYFVPVLAFAGALIVGLNLPSALRFVFIGGQLLVSTIPYFFPPVGVATPSFCSTPWTPAFVACLSALTMLGWFFARPLADGDSQHTDHDPVAPSPSSEPVSHSSKRTIGRLGD